MKIVINSCYGGFGLSHEAMLRIGELKGIKLYPHRDDWGITYWTVPLDEVPNKCSPEYNEFYRGNTVHEYGLDRNDPDLVQVVEEMGRAVNDGYSSLRVVDIPDDVEWQIEEYDGMEYVSEKHRIWS